MTEKEMIADRMMKNQFAANEVALFLDTHPNCAAALKAMETYRAEYAALKKEYEERFGMIDMYSPNNSTDSWGWVNSPWPWERM